LIRSTALNGIPWKNKPPGDARSIKRHNVYIPIIAQRTKRAMSTTTPVSNGHDPIVSTLSPTVLPFTPQSPQEPTAGAIASLDDPAPRPQTPMGNLDSLWSLLNERVARAAQQTPTVPAPPVTSSPEVQTTATVAGAVPTAETLPTAYGNAVSETYIVTETPVVPAEANTADDVVSAPPENTTKNRSTTEIVEVVSAPIVAATPEILAPTIVTPTQNIVPAEPPTVTPLKELLSATARRRAKVPVRLENSMQNGAFVLAANCQGYGLPTISLELATPLTKMLQSTSRTGEGSDDTNLLATLESVEASGEGKTSLKAVVAYTTNTPDIVIEIACEDGKDWQFSTQENGSDVSVEWEVTRKRGTAIVISAAIGRAKGEEDVLLELSRTLIASEIADAAPQWRNLVELKQAGNRY
jgi:uncharacterized membrane protein